jgi:uncharacterized membrane protein
MVPPEQHFRWRGNEITRLEGFTDAVFAFAVTLLVVSLEVPKTFNELVAAMKGFVAFAACFAVLAQVWHQHYLFSRRYGLQTHYATFLNSVLLFVVLFYVYPLKFLFTLTLIILTRRSAQPSEHAQVIIYLNQIPTLIVIFCIGFIAVATVFGLLYSYALRKRVQLDLSEYELVVTRGKIADCVVIALTGVITVVTAVLLPLGYAGLSGLLLSLGGVYRLIMRPVLRRKGKAALERMQAGAAEPAEAAEPAPSGLS